MAKSKKNWIPQSKKGGYASLLREKAHVNQKYTCFECTISSQQLICKGYLKVSEEGQEYLVEIRYRFKKAPEVYILNPDIPHQKDIHVYNNGSLCLYDWRDRPWTEHDSVATLLVPWLAEWLVLYELYLLSGFWHGKEAPHSVKPKTPEV